jgi:Protein of unknown function DUF115/Glycosyltransferase Maf N-terminal domain
MLAEATKVKHMKLSNMDDLLKANPKKRKKILIDTHAKNLEYFRKNAPASLYDSLRVLGSGRFEIRLNDTFLDILDRNAGGGFCHPPGRLLDYVRDFGGWHHTAWQDRLSVTHAYLGGEEHSEVRKKFISGIYDHAPQILEHATSWQVRLPKLKDGRRYSGTTIFLGIFTGLHIAQYLNTTLLKDIILIEPDMDRLALSCFFLDYTALHQRFGHVILHAGGDMPENPINYLMATANVTSAVWLRLLPAYPFGQFDEIIRRVSIRWNALHEIRVPFDREIRNLKYGAKNLQARLPVLAEKAVLSEGSRIVVVGSGPSLESDLSWLKKNQKRLIIISAHSAARVLKAAGISPDFYCTLDTEIEPPLLKKLDLDPNIPLFAYYKADPALLAAFKEVFLFHEENKANVVNFKSPLHHTHPTSGNTAVALAVFFKPSVLYLAGMDLGFKDAQRSHAAGTWHDDDEGAGHQATLASDILPAEANFTESVGEIFTYSYLNNARGTVEIAVHSAGDTTRVVNLSDGIRIAHAVPAHSAEEVVSAYPKKKKDLQAIRSAFSTDPAQVWLPYKKTAKETLDGFRQHLIEQVQLKKFDWLGFGRAIDQAWNIAANHSFREGEGDFRCEAFAKLIHDLLIDWYRALCHTLTPAEAETLYNLGLTSLTAVLNELDFGPELDSL